MGQGTFKELGDSLQVGGLLADPGSGGVVDLRGGHLCSIDVAASCKLPNAPKGTVLFIRATGSATITANTGGGTVATLAANDFTIVYATGDTSPYWENFGIA